MERFRLYGYPPSLSNESVPNRGLHNFFALKQFSVFGNFGNFLKGIV